MERRLKQEFKHKDYKIVDRDHKFTTITYLQDGFRIKVVLPNEYPFKAPHRMFIGEDEMTHDFFCHHPPDVLKRLKQTKPSGCYMCESYLCPDNWSCCGIDLYDVTAQMIDARKNIITGIYNLNTIPLQKEILLNICNYI